MAATHQISPLASACVNRVILEVYAVTAFRSIG